MSTWYWRNYRQQDNLASFAYLWDHFAIPLSLCLLFFMLAGLTGVLATAYYYNQPDADTRSLLLWVLFGCACTGVAGWFYAGIAAACIAHTAQRRLQALEQRLAALEAHTPPT